MTDTDKTPPTLREAVAAVLDEGLTKHHDDPWLIPSEKLLEALVNLKAAHEAPGAYGSPAGPFCPRCQKVQDDFHACQKAIADEEMGRGEDDPEDTIADLRKQLDEAKAELAEMQRRAERAEAERDDDAVELAEVRKANEGLGEMLKQAEAELSELRRNYDAVAQAVGVAYEAEGHDAVGGPVDQVVAQAARNRDDAIIADEWEQRARELDAEAELERQKTLADDMGEPASGVAMLRKLQEWCHDGHPEALRSDDPVGEVMDEIDRLIAEAEKPAENLTTEATDGEDSHREGDEVLRRWLNKSRKGDGFIDLQADAVAELCRRALGEGGDQ